METLNRSKKTETLKNWLNIEARVKKDVFSRVGNNADADDVYATIAMFFWERDAGQGRSEGETLTYCKNYLFKDALHDLGLASKGFNIGSYKSEYNTEKVHAETISMALNEDDDDSNSTFDITDPRALAAFAITEIDDHLLERSAQILVTIRNKYNDLMAQGYVPGRDMISVEDLKSIDLIKDTRLIEIFYSSQISAREKDMACETFVGLKQTEIGKLHNITHGNISRALHNIALSCVV